MQATGIASPEQLKVLTTALEEYCRANDVRPGTVAYEQAAGRIMAMFNKGVFKPEELISALGDVA